MKSSDSQIQQILTDTSQHLKASLATLASTRDVPPPLLTMYADFINQVEGCQSIHSILTEIENGDKDKDKDKIMELLKRMQQHARNTRSAN